MGTPPVQIPHLWRMTAILPRRWQLPQAFDPAWYGRAYPDAVRARGGVALHWLRHGRYEGRLPCALAAAEAEAALWAGHEDAYERLLGLAQDARRTEALWARLALARVAAARGDWGGAAAELAHLDPEGDLLRHLGLPAPLLFWLEIALQQPQTARAKALIELAEQGFGLFPALYLAKASLAKDNWSAALRPLYQAAGLPEPRLDLSKAPARFDRLSAPSRTRVTQGPLVSVILPARNAGRMLDTALSGLVGQSWQPLEILVIDNGSDDDTPLRMAAWAARDPRIQTIDGKAARGAYGARNLGLSRATGALITLQDADDWSHPDRIRLQAESLLAETGQPANLSFWARLREDLRVTALRPDVGMIHPNLSSLMMRRETAMRLGYWDQIRAGADSEYLDRLAHVFGAKALGHVRPDLPLAFGRVRAGSLSHATETGLFLGPGAAARSAYLAAAREWHQSSGTAPYLPQNPKTRPFAVPAALELPQ